MRLLIAEDDSDIVLVLYRALTPAYTVDIASSAEGALKKLDDGEYDAVILDLNLTNETGLRICEKIRSQGRHTPIMVLSGCSDVPDKVKLLDSGANDYLTKPFNMDELKARLRVITRRPAGASTERHRLVIGDLTLDSLKHQVERGGKSINLRKKEFAVLECLMKNAGRVVSRSSISDYAWEDHNYNLTNTVDVHIKHLRDKIDRPFDGKLIQTVHGLGYKIDIPRPEGSNIGKSRQD